MSALMSSLSSLAASATGLGDNTVSLGQTTLASAGASATSSAPSATSSKPAHKHWWDWFTDEAEKIEDWVDDFVHKHNPLEDDKEKQGSRVV